MERMVREAQEETAGDQTLGESYGARGGMQADLKQETRGRNGRKPSVSSLAANAMNTGSRLRNKNRSIS